MCLSLALSFAFLGCDGDDHGDVHVMVTQEPPSSADAGSAFDVSWMVHNDSHDDLHHSEVRVCAGADVEGCGLGETDSYTAFGGEIVDSTYTASISLDTAGSYTMVAWCHVGENPHLSDAYNLDIQ